MNPLRPLIEAVCLACGASATEAADTASRLEASGKPVPPTGQACLNEIKAVLRDVQSP